MSLPIEARSKLQYMKNQNTWTPIICKECLALSRFTKAQETFTILQLKSPCEITSFIRQYRLGAQSTWTY